MTTKRDMATEDFRTYLGQRVEDLDVQILELRDTKETQRYWTLELMACPQSRLLQAMTENEFNIHQAHQMLASLNSELKDAQSMLTKCINKHLYDYNG